MRLVNIRHDIDTEGTVVLEKTLESPLDWKEMKPVNSKGNQSLIFIERTYTEAEAPILWPPDAKCWLIWKDPDAGKDWRHEEKVTTEDEMVGWHHRLNGHEFEQAPWDSEGQGSLAHCSPQGTKSQTRLSDWTELNWSNQWITKEIKEYLQTNENESMKIQNLWDAAKTSSKRKVCSKAILPQETRKISKNLTNLTLHLKQLER